MVLRVAVIGAGPGGLAAASRVKRLLGDRAEVVVFEKTRWASFALCGIPLYLGFNVKRLRELIYYPIKEFTVKRRIKLNLLALVEEIDRHNRRILYRTKDGEKRVYEYDYLVLAMGASPKAPPEWLKYRNVFTLHSLDDAEKARSFLVSEEVEKVVVIGAGYLGFEAAYAIKSLGKRVIVVGRSKHVLSKLLDDDMAEHVEEAMKSEVELILGKEAIKLEGSSNYASKVVLSSGEEIEGDAFILAMGVKPNVELARRAGLRIGVTGAIWVNDRLQTIDEHIYAVGDCAETVNIITGERIWHPFAPIANKMGYIAGTNIAGGNARFLGVVGTSVVESFGIVAASTGLKERDASKRYSIVAAKVEARTRAHYVSNGGSKIVLKLIADANTGRLLGAQAVGDESAFWRVNVVAALLMRGASVWDLFSLDLGYMPKLSPVWDPLVIAARILLRSLHVEGKV